MADSTVPVSLPCGFINAAHRYLSAEAFRFQVVATGLVLRPRQVWVLRFVSPQGAGAAGQDEERGQRVHLISSLQRFLAADPNGKVTCEQEGPGSGALFLLRYYPDGKVSLQCELTQRYLGGTEDNVTCFAQAVSEGEKWSLQLAQHPNGLPWGIEAIINLRFNPKENKYGLWTADGNLLAADGSLQPEGSPHTLFRLEVRGGLLALRDADGKYLTGREAVVKTFKTDKPGRDELFVLEPSLAQVALRTFHTGVYVGCKPGADVSAGATAVGDTEVFQLLINEATKETCFRSCSGNYIGVDSSDILVSTSAQDKSVWFSLQYQAQRATLRSAENRYVTIRPNQRMMVYPDLPGKVTEFLLMLVNRPLVILQSEFGFVGLCPGTQRLDGNRPDYDASVMMITEDGHYRFRIENKNWTMDKDGLIMLTGERGSDFIIQFASSSCLVMKAPNNKYLVAEAGGRLWAGAVDVASATPFRY
nr:fascin-like [Pelodiscus sinensis]|eukprot:XP_014431317.1 fascin-like [Pelodiscus sinensis]